MNTYYNLHYRSPMLAELICMDLKRDAWKTRCFIYANTAIAKDKELSVYV